MMSAAAAAAAATTGAGKAGGAAGGANGNNKRARGGGGGPDASVVVEVRRSGRIRNQPAPIYTSFEVDEDLGGGVHINVLSLFIPHNLSRRRRLNSSDLSSTNNKKHVFFLGRTLS